MRALMVCWLQVFCGEPQFEQKQLTESMMSLSVMS
jgi:hypothetical protein